MTPMNRYIALGSWGHTYFEQQPLRYQGKDPFLHALPATSVLLLRMEKTFRQLYEPTGSGVQG